MPGEQPSLADPPVLSRFAAELATALLTAAFGAIAMVGAAETMPIATQVEGARLAAQLYFEFKRIAPTLETLQFPCRSACVRRIRRPDSASQGSVPR
jgi:hypothetical protein